MNAKKFLSLLLSIAMIASMAVVSMAADVKVSTGDALVEALAEGGTVVLETNIELKDNPITIPGDVEATLNLNGKTLTGIATSATTNYLIKVEAGAKLTVTGNGAISFGATTPDTNWGGEGQPAFPGYANNTISNLGAVVVEGVTIENLTAKGGASYCVDCYQGSSLEVKSGKLDGHDKVAVRTFANSKTLPIDVTISGGTVTGSRAVWIQLPSSDVNTKPTVNLTVSGDAKLVSTGESGGYNLAVYSYNYGNGADNVNIEISGGEIKGDIALTGGSNKTAVEKLTVTGGKLTDVYSYGADELAVKSVAISGGTFEVEPLDVYIADGYVAVEKNGAYEVVKETKVEISEESNVNTDVPVVLEKPGEGVVENNGDNSYAGLEPGYYEMTVTDNDGNEVTVLVEVKENVVNYDEANALVEGVNIEVDHYDGDVAVGNIAAQAKTIYEDLQKNPHGEPVTVTTVVNKMPIDLAGGEGHDDIMKAVSTGDAVDFVSIDLTYTIGNGAPQEFEDGETDHIIIVPIKFNFDKGVPTIIYRYHDGEVHEIKETANADGEYFTYDDYRIYLHAKYFSTYAIAYSSNSSAVSGGNGIILEGPYVYQPDVDVMLNENEATRAEETLEYGEPVYYLIVDETLASGAGEGFPINNKKYVEKLKVKADWNMGGSAVEGISVVKKYVNVDAAATECADILGESGYYYFLEINTVEKKVISETDVAGVIEFNRKAISKKGVQSIKDCKVDVDFTLFYPNTWLTEGQIESDRADLEWETPYVLKFNNDDEVELSFGGLNDGNNEGTFTVDVSGQGKIYLEYTTEADEAIAAANEGAKLYFITFNGANGVGVKFNRTGEFRYEMEDAAYAYEVVDGKLAPIAGLEVEDDEFVFNTNVLKAYVFSDTELNQPA